MTDAEAFERADVVFTGRLLEKVHAAGVALGIFAVDGVYKGDAGAS